ncbi:MAG: carboxymuconolactone decarboxylase family protein [Reichenbachiella sp.]|uniref:carboxymuconolactone decarboxylase family protein n=1 Tax=Reichenbachiella sp. TaxID=2184521 RepID=UPI0032640D6D
MTSDQIFKEIETKLGSVPGFFKAIPSESLAAEWELFKKATLETDSPLDAKVRELIGISAAAARLCWYCVNFHTELAKLHGASEREIQDTIALSRFGGSWSSFLNGIDYDKDEFSKELGEVVDFLS